jgi:hypothetical protein
MDLLLPTVVAFPPCGQNAEKAALSLERDRAAIFQASV